MNNLYVISRDTEGGPFPRYRYSDELFDWFYEKLDYYSFGFDEWLKCDVNIEMTRKDNSTNGCRIWDKDGLYVTLFEINFLMEFTAEEWKDIQNFLRDKVYGEITLSLIVDYFYFKNPHI